ncbi:type VI secretion system lipoprotein TssJ [Pectobacterium parmentieri]|uniref:Type VI secretion system lipoprotein TssJ n=1 Tax=Pectobacterium parmentieri TaxID=1905730 RepID=A0A8B3FC67_PECPM|nr:type VI secretion system lipoprotein TssJ [Pectobacterium parmentieri]AOR58519.1 type VI secretion system-associated lipoprotein [Pectobacterium parmentieri]AYH05923.1 type VI secretion system lipoprotein TssJ [Pectobacterium parmentieri]AYH10477.1 type VI secretion system lipoprotein TssJ [Pectobacterium parmentieri]AYH14744.1 type VI secretion system lipoprotein TssJ [Pectobacterium parmentieri]AYH18812.1 type VI secretion system lipoprotein TssJ [Pectobacterium parmentieri]
MMTIMQLRCWLLPLLALLLIACSSSPTPVARYNLHFQAHPQINSGAPLKVRVMLLTSDAEFMSADFYSLQNQPADALGSTLLNNQQFFLMSGQLSKMLNAKSLPEARYIGIMAEYQALDGKVWRLALPFPDGENSAFWAFWKSNDDELNAHMMADINGLRVVKQ